MDLHAFLVEERNTIVKKWCSRVLESYAPETSTLLKKESNQFANPVGHTVLHGIQAIYDEFLNTADSEILSSHLDRIIRIRAVQDFTPAQAISFVFALKQIVRSESGHDIHGKGISSSQLVAFDARVDELALLAFNIYVQCRERLFEARLNELRNRTFRLLQKADLLAEIPEWERKPKCVNR
jgi:hypothetical protein